MTPGSTVPVRVMTVDEALGWLADIFSEAKERIGPAARRGDIPGWDSLGQLLLISALDQELGIQLSPSELSALASVEDILHVLRSNGRLSRA